MKSFPLFVKLPSSLAKTMSTILLCSVLLFTWHANLKAANAQASASLPAAPSSLLRSGFPKVEPPVPVVVANAVRDLGLELSDDSHVPAERQAHLQEEMERNTACEQHLRRGKACRVSWARVLGESFLFLASQHGGNIWMDKDTRRALIAGDFWGRYIDCVDNYRYSRWKDDDPFAVDYIGHPMMGAMTNSIYEQNDPKQRALTYENSGRYWFGRLRATAYSAAYSAQWKLGPLSEASIGNTGIGYYVRARDGVLTNETGMQDFFITPIGGLSWNVGEDAIDRFIFSHVRHAHKNRVILFVASFMMPLKSGANLARFRAPYYRDADERSAGLMR